MGSPSFQCGGERQVRGWDPYLCSCYKLFPRIFLPAQGSESYSSQFTFVPLDTFFSFFLHWYFSFLFVFDVKVQIRFPLGDSEVF